MKKFAMLVVVGILFTTVQTGVAQNLLRGFSGIAWGTSIDVLQDLEETARSGDIRYYRRPGDFYRFAGITLPEVVYGFYKDRYFAAYLRVASPEHFAKIKSYLQQRYGDPRAQLRIDQTIYIWDYLDAKIKLKQYQDHPEAKLAFYYVPLSIQANEARGSDKNVSVYPLDDLAPDYDF